MALARRSARHLASTGGDAGRGQNAGRASFGAHERWIATVSPPGGMRSKPTNTARGTPGKPAKPAATIACVLYPHRTQGCGVCGPGVPRALAPAREDFAQNLGRAAPRERCCLTFAPLCNGPARSGVVEFPNVESVLGRRHGLRSTTADVCAPNGAGAYRGRSCWKRKPSRD